MPVRPRVSLVHGSLNPPVDKVIEVKRQTTGRTWRCPRIKNKVRCNHENPMRVSYCGKCGEKSKPKRRRSTAATSAISETYEQYAERQGGEFCALCLREAGTPTSTGKPLRLVRDHDHRTGRCRGLLCDYCNRILGARYTPDWLRRAADYLDRYQEDPS